MRQRLPGLAAEMAYNNALALFPAMIGILTVIGTFHISPEQIDTVTQQWLQVVPPEIVELIGGFFQQLQLSNSQQVFSISFGITLWVASSAIGVAMAAMDQIYQIPFRQRRPFWQSRLLAIFLTIATLMALLGASFLIVISDLIVKLLINHTTIPATGFWQAWSGLRWLLAFALLIYGFGVLYRYGPSQWQAGTPLLPGAVAGALLWVVISQGFRIYLIYFGSRLNLTYGALSAGILLLLWLNLSSLSLLIGAQLNVTLGEILIERSKRAY